MRVESPFIPEAEFLRQQAQAKKESQMQRISTPLSRRRDQRRLEAAAKAQQRQPDAYDRQMLAAGKRYAEAMKSNPVGTRREQIRQRIGKLESEGRLDCCYRDSLERHLLDVADDAGLEAIQRQIELVEERPMAGRDDAAIAALADNQVAKIQGVSHETVE